MTEIIKNFFIETFTNPYIATILISMLPIIELRGGVPFCYVLLKNGGMETLPALTQSYVTAFIGSSFVVPFLLLLLIPLINYLKKTKLFRRIAEKIEHKFHKKSLKLEEEAKSKSANVSNEDRAAKVEKMKYFGLFIFTAIPLPLTGVWTASAMAAFLKLNFKKSLFWILLGNLTAGAIMVILSFFVGSLFGINI